MFYSPFDIVYKMVKFLPCKLAIAGLKEVQRAHKVYHGVVYTAKIYPNSVLIILFIGTIKGKIVINSLDVTKTYHFQPRFVLLYARFEDSLNLLSLK